MGRRGGPSRVLVAEIVGSGRGVAAQPVFEAGRPTPLLRRAQGAARIGDLATVQERGRTVEVLRVHGPAASPGAVMEALLADAEVRTTFPRAVEEEAAAIPGRLGGSDAARRDLTDRPAITIDPEGAKDHDDAISVAREGEALRLWVHIADVARYVAAGGAIDREAARRGNSVYVPGTVAPMLPRRLSTDLCSLRPGEVRDAVTAEMVVLPDGEIAEARFYRSAILSRERLTYPLVDEVLAGRTSAPEGLAEPIALSAEVARRLRTRRMARGALDVVSGEPSFRLGPRRIEDGHIEGQTPAHSLVEECMIAANEAVARHLIARRTPTVFRYHEDPDGGPVLRMLGQLEELGVPLPPIPEAPLGPTRARELVAAAAEALRAHLRSLGLPEGGPAARALWGLLLRSLTQAHYSADHVGHSGLASAAYLHFTSPIRRYPDLLVHRGLLAGIGAAEEPGPDPVTCAQAALRSSETERAAAALERRADRICAALLLEQVLADAGEGGAEFDGTVSGVVDGGLFVGFGDLFDGFLPARSLGREWFHMHPLEIGLIGDDSGTRLLIGDPVRVRVVRVEAFRGRVELEPVGLGPSRTVARRRARARGG